MIDQPQGDKPALTVVVQSWWTPALAVIMLVVGLLAGYFGRPLLNKDSATGETATGITPVATAPIAQITVPTSTVDPTVAAITNKDQLMAYLISNTTHFKGDPNAPVTIIEFSDYQ
ncbi:MAG: hypothetical protein A2136_05240 [Chloroflexi bacterium RBG_16_54_11]|nr:MAG: hypothetical protein A2136_05240 [Chloroflexi bacterium RBG_16_54_11]